VDIDDRRGSADFGERGDPVSPAYELLGRSCDPKAKKARGGNGTSRATNRPHRPIQGSRGSAVRQAICSPRTALASRFDTGSDTRARRMDT
jgi:hypothetical protein